MTDKKINILMAGFGNVGRVIARDLLVKEDLKLFTCILEKNEGFDYIEISENGMDQEIKFIPEFEHYKFLCENFDKIDIVVDFTSPAVVERNVSLYCQLGLPFFLGTTGGDRDSLEFNVAESEISAVIAPNAALQIVGFQAMMEYAAENFPGLFQDYELRIVESHQSTKADTSGTAKAMVKYFNRLGAKNGLGERFEKKNIIQERDRNRQRSIWEVKEEYLDGHAWHVYDLTSPDGTVFFSFKHQVNGRQIYPPGVYRGIKFLYQKIQEGSSGEVFSMIDILKSGQKK